MSESWRTMHLAEHFRLGEFAVSQEHPELAELIRFADHEIERCRYLACAYLQPLRSAMGKPVRILSGKRSPELNRAVGGVPNSDHLMLGGSIAVDLAVEGMAPRELADWFRSHTPYWKQLIFYPHRGFVHLSLPDYSDRRLEFLEAKPGGGYVSVA